MTSCLLHWAKIFLLGIYFQRKEFAYTEKNSFFLAVAITDEEDINLLVNTTL